MLKKLLQRFLRNKHLYSIVLIGSLCWSLVMIRSGLKYPYGYGFWGANGHDGIWHLALSESLAKGTLENPVFSGEGIKNYHLGFDLLLTFIHKTTNISISHLYFQILPPIFAILIGILVYKFVKLWRGSVNEALWSTAFVYFSGGFGFLVTYLRDGVFTGESMFWSSQSVSTLVNPPFALSLILILSGLIFLIKYIKNHKAIDYLLCLLSFGFLLQIKAYAAILVIAGLFIASFYSFLKNRDTSYFKVFILVILINFALYLLFKTDSVYKIFIWEPMWFLETMMSYSDRLGWERFYSAMTTYRMGDMWFKGVLAYSVALVIFLIGNMGLRITGFLVFIKLLKKEVKLDSIFIMVISMILIAVTIPTFFVQNGTPWNTIQFFYYYLFFFAIFAGIAMSWLITLFNNRSKNIFKLIFLVFAVFSVWSTLQHYLPTKPQAIISTTEIEALNFLSKLPDGVVLTYPYNKDKVIRVMQTPPRPLYAYDSTSYVFAYSGKRLFLDDEVNLNIMGYDWQTRHKQLLKFIGETDKRSALEFLDNNDIKYLYLVKEISPTFGEQLKLGSTELGLKMLFENKEVMIFSVGK